jgi:hypothetical protein
LPASRRNEWYRVLNEMGYNDPGGDDVIPSEFESDQWWRNNADQSASSERPRD